METDQLNRQDLMKRYQQLGQPKLDAWGRMAQEHWKENLPELTSYLQSKGLWSLATLVAQAEAKERFGELVDNGMNPDGAKELALKEFILLDPPTPDDPQDQQEGEANQVSAFLRMLQSNGNGSRSSTLPQPPTTTSSETPPPSTPEG